MIELSARLGRMDILEWIFSIGMKKILCRAIQYLSTKFECLQNIKVVRTVP